MHFVQARLYAHGALSCLLFLVFFNHSLGGNERILTETEMLVIISGSLLLAIVISILLIIAMAKYCGKKISKPVREQVFLPFHETHTTTHGK